MKFFLKFIILLALIIGGKLSKSVGEIAVVPKPKAPASTQVSLVNQRSKAALMPRSSNDYVRPQVLSVFFK